MPTFETGSPHELRRKQAAKTLGPQIQSLTFFERAKPAPAFPNQESTLGLLLAGANNSLFNAGFQIRTQPRFQIGNRTGREFEQRIAITPGRGTLDVIYNPALPLHRELAAPNLEGEYLVRSVMAPPWMNMAASQYEVVSSTGVSLNTEDQPMTTIELLDNYGAEVVPSLLMQLEVDGRDGGPTESLSFKTLTGTATSLTVGRDDSNADQDIDLGQAGVVTIEITTATGAIAFATSGGLPDLSASTANGFDTMVLLHMPGAGGGYVAGANLKDVALSGGTIATDKAMTDRIIAAERLTMYMGIYSTESTGLLFREP